MADGAAGSDGVVDVVGLPSGRRRRIGVILAALVIPALVVGSVWAFGSSSGRRLALVPQPTDSTVVAEAPVPTEPPPATTMEVTTMEVTTAPSSTDLVPVDPPSTAGGHPGTVQPDPTQGCNGDQPRVFVPLLIPNLIGTDFRGWINSTLKFQWDSLCTHQPTNYGFQPNYGDCAPDPSQIQRAYAQEPSAGTTFTLGGQVMITLTVYRDCNAPPPTPPSVPAPPPPTTPPPPGPPAT
jgi:hypothetical protein